MLPWKQLLPGSVEKLVSSNLCWGTKKKTQKYLYIGRRNRKSVVMTIVARYCPKKLSSSNPCRGMECKEPTKIFIYGSKKQKKSVAMETLVARYCRKTSQLQSMQGYGMQRTHKMIFKAKKHEKVLPSTHKISI